MQHIFVDFEMNAIPKKNTEARAVYRSEIIEIGAVKLNEQYQQVGKYSRYVHPILADITPRTTEITGITGEDVQGAKDLPEALAEFIEWIGEEPCRIYAWSDSDRRQLVGECTAKGIYPDGLPKQFRRWMDFQRIYTRLMGLSRRNPLSLTNALGASEGSFSGSQHSAVADAENSASLLALVKDKEAFAERTRIVRQLMGKGEEPAGATLGDLFDLSSIPQRKPRVKSDKKNKKKKR